MGGRVPNYSTSYEAKHSASDMFAMVADVASYPEFVPLCTGMDILSRAVEDGREIVDACMTVAAGPISERFTNRVVLDRENLKISGRAIDGPFKKLTNDWSFEPLSPQTCRIDFALDYEFRSMALRLLLGAVSESAFGRYTKAFEDRADALYGV